MALTFYTFVSRLAHLWAEISSLRLDLYYSEPATIQLRMYRSHLGNTLVAIIFGMVAANLSLRATSLRVDSVHTLRDVVVTERLRSLDVVPSQRLSGKTLERMGSVSIADALRYFAGTQIKDYGGVGGLKTINIRSMGSQHVGIFYDGMRIGNAQNAQVDLSRFSLDNIESVAIYNGQKSSILQPATHYASASTVYLQTKIPDFSSDNQRSHIKLTGRVGSFGTVNPSALYELKISPRLTLSVNGEYLYTTGRYEYKYKKVGGYDTTAMRRNGDVRALRLEASLAGAVGGGSLRAKAYLYDSERGYPGAVVREIPGMLKHEDRQWDRNIFVQSSWRKHYGRYSLLLSGKYANDYLHYLSDPNKDVSTMYVDNHYRQQELYLSLAHQYTLLKGWHIALSTDLQYNTLTADLYDFAYPTRLSALTALSSSVNTTKLRAQMSLLHSYYRDWVREGDESAPVRSILTPAVVLSYQPWLSVPFQLRAFYKSIFRMPTFNDLYYTFIGSKHLKPEETKQYNVGLSYTPQLRSSFLKNWSVECDAYLNYVENKIIAMPTSNQFQWTMVNLGKVEIKGVELKTHLEASVGALGVSTLLNYTYQRAEDITDQSDPFYRGQIAYIPRHSASAIVGLAFHGWCLNYSFIYTGERYDGSANIRENYILPWYTHDLSLTKAFRVLGQRFRATMEINNLFNQQYEVVRSYPMPGTHAKLKLEWNI